MHLRMGYDVNFCAAKILLFRAERIKAYKLDWSRRKNGSKPRVNHLKKLGLPEYKLLTPEQMREYRSYHNKLHYHRNPEKCRARSRAQGVELRKNPEFRKKNIEYMKKYYAENADKMKAYQADYIQRNMDKVIARRMAYQKKNGTKLAANQLAKYRADPSIAKRMWSRSKERMKSEPGIRVKSRLRTRLIEILKSSAISKSKTLGYSASELRESLERKFRPGMTWDNYGSEWVVDHIIPVVKFDGKSPSEMRECFSLFNLQPLWKKENRDKWHRVLKQAELTLDIPLRETTVRA